MTAVSTDTHRRLGLVLLALLVAAMSACADTSGTATSSSASSTASTPSMQPDAGSAAAATAPQDPVAAAAWEALMGPDGEYAASAAYAAVIERYGEVEPYVSIQAAEQRHVAALSRWLERHGVSVADNPWTGQIAAPQDLATAAQAWADGEVANVALYDDLMSRASSDAQLTRIFTNLRRASQEQHLPAFTAAAANGGTLTADELRTVMHG